jgi:hypothetical protein
LQRFSTGQQLRQATPIPFWDSIDIPYWMCKFRCVVKRQTQMTRFGIVAVAVLFWISLPASIFAQEAHPPEARPEGHQEAAPAPHPETAAPPPHQEAPRQAPHPEQARPASPPQANRPPVHQEAAKPAPRPQEAHPAPQSRPPEHQEARPAPARPPEHQEARPAPPPPHQQAVPANREHGNHPQASPQQRQAAQAAWQSHRAQHWESQHRSWQQRGGYRGYRIPDQRYNAYFGPGHVFPIYSVPVQVVGGYPRFQYQGFWFTVMDPWPATWGDDWYYQDNVYVVYTDGGYYLCNPSYPGVMLAVNVAM